jgi:hypothetical protein
LYTGQSCAPIWRRRERVWTGTPERRLRSRRESGQRHSRTDRSGRALLSALRTRSRSGQSRQGGTASTRGVASLTLSAPAGCGVEGGLPHCPFSAPPLPLPSSTSFHRPPLVSLAMSPCHRFPCYVPLSSFRSLPPIPRRFCPHRPATPVVLSHSSSLHTQPPVDDGGSSSGRELPRPGICVCGCRDRLICQSLTSPWSEPRGSEDFFPFPSLPIPDKSLVRALR